MVLKRKSIATNVYKLGNYFKEVMEIYFLPPFKKVTAYKKHGFKRYNGMRV